MHDPFQNLQDDIYKKLLYIYSISNTPYGYSLIKSADVSGPATVDSFCEGPGSDSSWGDVIQSRSSWNPSSFEEIDEDGEVEYYPRKPYDDDKD